MLDDDGEGVLDNDGWGGVCFALGVDDDDSVGVMEETSEGRIGECGRTCDNANKYDGAENHIC
jgi:hypothetical protein